MFFPENTMKKRVFGVSGLSFNSSAQRRFEGIAFVKLKRGEKSEQEPWLEASKNLPHVFLAGGNKGFFRFDPGNESHAADGENKLCQTMAGNKVPVFTQLIVCFLEWFAYNYIWDPPGPLWTSAGFACPVGI